MEKDLFVSKEERYAELGSFYRDTYPDNEIKQYIEGNEKKVQFVKENYPAIIEYLKKECPNTIDVYYDDTKQVDDRKIVVLATDASFFVDARKDQHHIVDKEHFVSGLNLLTEIGENVTWSKEAYIKNFPKILDYLEKHDGLDVAKVREMYVKQVEENKNNPHNPELRHGGELAILEPGPSVETELTKLVEKAKLGKFENLVERGPYYDARKYYKVTVLRTILKKQNLEDSREQYRSNMSKSKPEGDILSAVPVGNTSVNPKQNNGR